MSKTIRTSTERQPQKGRRYTAEQKHHALLLVASGMKRVAIADATGATVETLRRWVKEAEANGGMPALPVGASGSVQRKAKATRRATTSKGAAKARGGNGVQRAQARRTEEAYENESAQLTSRSARPLYAPKDPGQGLSEAEVEAVLKLKSKHPSMGPAQIRAQLKRFKGWRVSNRAIARVLQAHGYELVHRGSRPQGPEPVRFEAPRRNALWQMDFTALRVGMDKMHLLVILDDFSRFAVGHGLFDAPEGDAASELLRLAIARHGVPEAVRTDRGGAFQSAEFARMLEAELIDHIVGRSYHPQGGGKVESLIGTVRRELWDVEQFVDRDEARRRLEQFIEHYNEHRAHMGIDGLTPADRFFGRADRVLATVNALSRRRQGVAPLPPAGTTVEELTGLEERAPTEVLRLVLLDGQMQLRFCGAQVDLGRVERR